MCNNKQNVGPESSVTSYEEAFKGTEKFSFTYNLKSTLRKY